VPLLGRIPLDAALREAGDEGEPIISREPSSVPAAAIREIAHAVDESRAGGFTRTLPLVS
jgi:ATP-binding protein involved in chromosome partitioning